MLIETEQLSFAAWLITSCGGSLLKCKGRAFVIENVNGNGKTPDQLKLEYNSSAFATFNIQLIELANLRRKKG